MNLVRTKRRATTVPKRVEGCLRALGVEIRQAPSFWLEHCDELDWLLKDAHRVWRQRLIASHPDYCGTHEEAAYWNAVWAQIEKSFRWHGVTMGGQSVSLLRSGNPRRERSPEEQLKRKLTKRTQYRLRVGIPVSAPLWSWFAGKPVAHAATVTPCAKLYD